MFVDERKIPIHTICVRIAELRAQFGFKKILFSSVLGLVNSHFGSLHLKFLHGLILYYNFRKNSKKFTDAQS